ncbi:MULTISPECIES: response regulator [Geobacter]|jgi:two-component system phosphate regulon response regulator PhoB|uniref:Phosphate regulon transcriptional regulatory protein PhoB n=1 Tax=Geobacter sulfurreducens (strain ATCC 51573 / DSM 12127 / PCA) TaxID=243231 RepID=Q74E62_GEOSL|nr:response regulator transcription factor [Geobacter sulfurreducens]BET58747.1 response regulator transcription factor [Geobacter sp. 60473]AAR34428.1 winged-helix phosphate transcriptional response regulator [Geobacter sulfurreducens PCA]ADI83939.1 winged-helix phosphate transcriptional response regulator [Geobacter sulfurreducens KN400]AJY70823.1 ArsR family transcriptional regulator [Geobacter sulfurreducens]UAC05145.1 response regulator transcription factor [Geobacter sulfurreducens]
MKTILIIEDERDLADLVAFNLEKEGYRTLTALDGANGLELARSQPPDLILLDLMLPGMMGMEVCKILKKSEKTAHIPVIMLTARGEEIDRVVGFEVGADDYVVKPFSTRELLLRVKAVLRRSLPDKPEGKVINVGPVTIDTERHMVAVEGDDVTLTTTEFKLLLNLAERLGRVQSRDLLLKNVWGYNYVGDTRTVDTHITRLRTKLGQAGELIKTVRGFGYKMEE